MKTPLISQCDKNSQKQMGEQIRQRGETFTIYYYIFSFRNNMVRLSSSFPDSLYNMLLNGHFIDLGVVFHHFYDAVLGTTAMLEGEVGGEGLLSRNGSPGATNATTFSFFESQNAG